MMVDVVDVITLMGVASKQLVPGGRAVAVLDRRSAGANPCRHSIAAAPSLLPGLLFGARLYILGYLYAGEEIEIARRM
jgi:hypothetical protein